MPEKIHDPSTIATLHPTQGRELAFKSYRTSPRLQGSHRMLLTRPSRLPESGREYAPGDPVALIDWKAFARTDQLIIRETRDEATARVRIVLDASETMQWPRSHLGETSQVVSKAEVAARCALNLAYLHQRVGDLVEIWPLLPGKTSLDQALRPRSSMEIISLCDRLLETDCDPQVLAAAGRAEPEPERRVDLVYWVGDALSVLDPLARLTKGRGAVMIHVLSSLETDVTWVEGETSYFDDEILTKEYQGQMLQVKHSYRDSLERWRSGLEQKVRTAGGEYGFVTDQTLITRWQAFVNAIPRTLQTV